jgi:hypothetical protein
MIASVPDEGFGTAAFVRLVMPPGELRIAPLGGSNVTLCPRGHGRKSQNGQRGNNGLWQFHGHKN